jgi:hypothetical protein
MERFPRLICQTQDKDVPIELIAVSRAVWVSTNSALLTPQPVVQSGLTPTYTAVNSGR